MLNSTSISFYLLSIYAFLLGLQEVSANASGFVVLGISMFFVTVILAQSLFIFGLRTLVKLKIVETLAKSFLTAVNFFAFYFSLFDFILQQSLSIQLLMFLLFFAALFGLFYFVDKKVVVTLFVRLITLFLIAFNLILLFVSVNEVTIQAEQGVMEKFNIYKDIKFKKKPNIHLVSFDSMMPESLAEKYLGINVNYADVLREKGAVVFKNGFASQVPTQKSLSSISRLGDKRFFVPEEVGYFSGRELSPLYFIFKKNGYKLASGFEGGKKTIW